MTNRLKAYCRRTILEAAREYAYPSKRRTPESTKSAFMDAMRGTDTGWWTDLIYTAGMLEMAHKYRNDIATALAQYRDVAGESYTYRGGADGEDITAESILAALIRRKPYTFDDYRESGETVGPESALIGLRFAVEWYAGELAHEYAPDL